MTTWERVTLWGWRREIASALAEGLLDLLERVPPIQRVVATRRTEAYFSGLEVGESCGQQKERRRCSALVNERLAELEAEGASRPRATTVLRAVRGRIGAGYEPRRGQTRAGIEPASSHDRRQA